MPCRTGLPSLKLPHYMNENEKRAVGPQEAVQIFPAKNSRNAIVFVVCLDIVKGYQAIIEWPELDGDSWALDNVSVAPITLNMAIKAANGQPPQGFGITAKFSR